MKRYAIGAVVGALAWFIWQPEPIALYDTVIVTRTQIVDREMDPGPPSIIERVRYVYLQPDVRATAPGGAVEDVARFCRPVTVVDYQGSAPWVIRTVAYRPSWVPLRKAELDLTTMNGNGDLAHVRYHVRQGFEATWGDQVRVRYPRWSPLTEIGKGALWYAGFRALEAVVRIR